MTIMKPEDFVKKIRESILDENVGIYKDLFDSTGVDEASDGYWKEALQFYGKLNSEDRDTLFKIIKVHKHRNEFVQLIEVKFHSRGNTKI